MAQAMSGILKTEDMMSKDVIRLAQSGNKPTAPVEDHGSKPKKNKG